jgi:hypothetical protein
VDANISFTQVSTESLLKYLSHLSGLFLTKYSILSTFKIYSSFMAFLKKKLNKQTNKGHEVGANSTFTAKLYF